MDPDLKGHITIPLPLMILLVLVGIPCFAALVGFYLFIDSRVSALTAEDEAAANMAQLVAEIETLTDDTLLARHQSAVRLQGDCWHAETWHTYGSLAPFEAIEARYAAFKHLDARLSVARLDRGDFVTRYRVHTVYHACDD